LAVGFGDRAQRLEIVERAGRRSGRRKELKVRVDGRLEDLLAMLKRQLDVVIGRLDILYTSSQVTSQGYHPTLPE
jgi:hypothetical protein